MRAGFAQELEINTLAIKDVVIPTNKKRAKHLADILFALQTLHGDADLSMKIEKVLRDSLNTKTAAGKGSKGASLWEIFVMCQIRMVLNISADEVEDYVNNHRLVRSILGLEVRFGEHNSKTYSRSTVFGILSMVSDQALTKINDLVVEWGRGIFEPYKKKEEALRLKTDSFVVEADVHFPTDYRSVYESGRKCNELCFKLADDLQIPGWRQYSDNVKKLKKTYRTFGKISSGGGKNKDQRTLDACNDLLEQARKEELKVKVFIEQAYKKAIEVKHFILLVEIEWFLEMLTKHIDQLERRVIKGEKIPHQEKVFSIFQAHVEWINKGKRNVEIGRKLFITTDQYHLIVDHSISKNQQDNELFQSIVTRVKAKLQSKQLYSWSTDKGFYSKENKQFLQEQFTDIKAILPKKGKKNQAEKIEESDPEFILLKNKHCAVESNINELEHRGLNRCPSRNWISFQKYISAAVLCYNLHKIGRKLSEKAHIKKEKFSQAA